MSNPESFIEEVTEEVRRDRLFAMFRKYGWIAVLLVVALVGGAAYTAWQQQTRADEAKAFGDELLTALDQDSPEARRKALADVAGGAKAAPDKLAVVDLLEASDPKDAKAATLAALEAVIADTSISQTYRDLAVLRQVILAGPDMDIAKRRAALDPLAVAGRPFRPLALEQMAYLDVEAGKTDAAIAQFRALSTDQGAPAGLRQRAAQMIVALGGEVAEG